MLIIKNVSLFDGTSLQKNRTVITAHSKILDVRKRFYKIPHKSSKITIIDGKENILAPGFIDIQINGGGGFLFNKTPTPLVLNKIFQAHLKYGTTGYFPTFISDTFEKTQMAIDAVEKKAKKKNSGILGIHLEGPLINKEKKGIHNKKYITNESQKFINLIINSKIQKRLITVAPEVIGTDNIAKLTKNKVFVFAGHTLATGDELKKYFREGIGGVTHLFNACSQITSRDIGTVGASLLEKNLSTLIIDENHISDDMLRIGFKVKDPQHFALISDSMELVGTNNDSFQLNNDVITLTNSCLKNQSGTLAGAHLTILWAFQNLMKKKLVSLIEGIKMTSTNQAQYFGLKNKGAILPNFDADMVLLDKNNFNLLNVFFLGKIFDHIRY